jgi:hypothetical protein
MSEIISQLREDIVSNNVNFLKDKSFFEFGVYEGKSLLMFYDLYKKYLSIENSSFYGFDSFQGLPEEIKDKNNPSYCSKGEYSVAGNISEGLNQEKIKIVKGFFSESLTEDFAASLNQKIGLLHIDCDIYTSTYQALDFCFKNNLIVPGTIIMYDDWGGYHEKQVNEFECGEGLAHKEIMQKYNKKCIFKPRTVITENYHEIATFIVE